MEIKHITDNDIALIPTPVVCDTHLSLGASGLYARLVCAKASDNFNFIKLVKNNNKLEVKNYLNELVKCGYVRLIGHGKNRTMQVIN